MSERSDRSCFTSSRVNVGRQSRREASLEGSRLPTYRRSKSAASLNVSGLKGKQSLGCRSSSTSRNMQPQRLFDSTQKVLFQPTNSSVPSNKFLTPLDQRTLRASNSAKRLTSCTKYSPRFKQSGNKDDQKKELSKEVNRIRLVLTSINCDTHLTRPLVLRDFVSLLINLFETLHIVPQVTFANYITVVPNIMKLLQYTGNVSTAFLKSVNTMHNWPNVLNIFSYLCDLVEVQFGRQSEFFENCNADISIFRNIACRTVFAKESQKLKMCPDLATEILKAKGADVKEIEKDVEKVTRICIDIEEQERDLKLIQCKYDIAKKQEEDIEMELQQLKKCKESTEIDFQINMKSMTEQIKELDLCIPETYVKYNLTQEQLNGQTCSNEDVFEFQQEINDYEETCLLLKERNKKMEIDWNDDFLELSKINGKTKATSIIFNDRLKKMLLNNVDCQIILVPENGFSKYSKEEFESIVTECLSSTIHERIAMLNEKLVGSEKECNKNFGIMEDLKKEICRIKRKNNHKGELQKRQRQEYDKKLETIKKTLADKRNEILSFIDDQDKQQLRIIRYEQLRLQLDKKIVELKSISKTNINNANETLNGYLCDIAGFLEKYMEKYGAYNAEKHEIQKKIDALKEEL